MDEPLLRKYFSDDCTPAEAQAVLSWLRTDDGRAYLHTRLRSALDRPSADADQPWQALWLRREAAEAAAAEAPASWRWWAGNYGRWAAVFLGTLLLATGAMYTYRYLYPNEQTAQTQPGQAQTITLADESVVTLTGNSQLRYHRSWSAGLPREVWLDGSASFRVTQPPHNERFLVYLPNQLTIDSPGATFTVVAQPKQLLIELHTGQLDVRDASGRPISLQPGHRFSWPTPATR